MSIARKSAEAQSGPTVQYLTFVVAGETFGMRISGIREIISYAKLTKVPLMPEAVAGVMNLRGEVLAVVDLAERMELPRSQPSKRTSIVVIELSYDGAEFVLGGIVDSIDQVRDIAQNEIAAPPTFGNRIRTDFIEGIAKVGDDFMILLDAENVLDVDDLAQVSEVRATVAVEEVAG